MAITPLSVIPNATTSPTTFSVDMDDHLAELPTMISQMNATAAAMDAAVAGGAVTIPYTFSTTTTDSDPGAGILRLDNATQNTATTIRADLVGSDGSTWTDVLATFDDSTSAVKGQIRLINASDATKWLLFNVTALAAPSGYKNITVTIAGYSAASPFTNGDSLALFFTRTGDKGDTGDPGGLIGGATPSGSMTLSAGAAYTQRVTPSGYGQACTADAATTFTEGPIVSLFNASDYDYAFTDSTGVIRAFIPPWEACDIGLADNATAAGVWTFNNYNLLGITASTSRTSTGASEGGNTTLRFVSLDSDRSMLLYGTTHCYARVFRTSTGVWAAPVLVRSGAGSTLPFRAVKAATDKVLVVSCVVSATSMEAVVLSVDSSTDVVTVNTAVPVTLAGNLATLGELIATAAYFTVAYGRATNVSALRGLSVSGTTPAFTAEQALSAIANTTPAILSYSAGDVFMAFACESNTSITSYPVTLSAGPTLTLGTSVAVGTNSTSQQFRVLRMSSTKWHAFMKTSATDYLKGAVITLTGTVATKSETPISATVTDDPATYADVIAVSTTKSCIVYGASGGNTVYFNHLIDTAGTASAGTELTAGCSTIATDSFSAIALSGSICKFAGSFSGNFSLYLINSSSTSPSLNDVRESGGISSTANSPSLVYPTARDGGIDPTTVVSTAGVARIAPAKGATGGVRYGSDISTIPAVHYPTHQSPSKGMANVTKGYTSAESWFYRQGPSGWIHQLVKVEAAQP